MARLARVVVPDLPHHVTQRGNRREPVFFEDGDYRFYLDLIAEAARRSKTMIASYCLMPNHVHFLMIPSHGDGLRQTFAEAHRRYSGANTVTLYETLASALGVSLGSAPGASPWPASPASSSLICRTTSPSAAIGASRCSSRRATTASTWT
jgi:hypothetical protein